MPRKGRWVGGCRLTCGGGVWGHAHQTGRALRLAHRLGVASGELASGSVTPLGWLRACILLGGCQAQVLCKPTWRTVPYPWGGRGFLGAPCWELEDKQQVGFYCCFTPPGIQSGRVLVGSGRRAGTTSWPLMLMGASRLPFWGQSLNQGVGRTPFLWRLQECPSGPSRLLAAAVALVSPGL